jgi:hypothetical protein
MVGLRLRRPPAGDRRLQVHRHEISRPQHRRDRPEGGGRVLQQQRGTAGEVQVPGERQRDAARGSTSTAGPAGQPLPVSGGPAHPGGGPRRGRSRRAARRQQQGQQAGPNRKRPPDHHPPSLRLPAAAGTPDRHATVPGSSSAGRPQPSGGRPGHSMTNPHGRYGPRSQREREPPVWSATRSPADCATCVPNWRFCAVRRSGSAVSGVAPAAGHRRRVTSGSYISGELSAHKMPAAWSGVIPGRR